MIRDKWVELDYNILKELQKAILLMQVFVRPDYSYRICLKTDLSSKGMCKMMLKSENNKEYIQAWSEDNEVGPFNFWFCYH